jgi:hypothetical protein
MPHSRLQVLYRREEESWTLFARRIRETDAEVIVLLTAADTSLFLQEEHHRQFLEECAKLRHRVRIATRHPQVIAAARAAGIRVFDKTKILRQALAGHPQKEEALRQFSPSLWRQQWRSRLQSAGLLMLPRLRVLFLIALSAGLFLFVIFRLLPSAEVRIAPRGDLATQTTNLLLIQSGAIALPSRIRTLPLTVIESRATRSINFDQISKQFIGTNAEVPMTVINRGKEDFSLRKGTRVQNQAGMVFKLQNGVVVPANGTMTVRAKAQELDAYGEIVGERGNVPAGVQWQFPALSADDRKFIVAENRVPATGGKTEYRTVLQKTDIDAAQRRLEQELLSLAKKDVEQKIQGLNLLNDNSLHLLTSDQLVKATFSGFVLPVQLLNQPVTSISVQGQLIYRALAYNAKDVLQLVSSELESHVSADKHLLPETVNLQHMDVRVFDYADDLSWIKATAELSATEQFVLDPLTPAGVRFGKDVREKIVGLSKQDALRIVKNLPEVEKAEIRLWPPWDQTLPTIPSNISIVTE